MLLYPIWSICPNLCKENKTTIYIYNISFYQNKIIFNKLKEIFFGVNILYCFQHFVVKLMWHFWMNSKHYLTQMMINNNSNWKQTLYCKRKNRAVNPFAISEKKWFTLINKFIIQIYDYIIQNHSTRDINWFNISKCHYFGYNFGYNSTYELSKKNQTKICLSVCRHWKSIEI